MRTFISHLLSGASAREEYVSPAAAVIAGMEVHSVPVEEPVPTYARARSILQTAIERLTDRQAVLMKEIAERQAELYETNKTLEGLDTASSFIARDPATDDLAKYHGRAPLPPYDPDRDTASEIELAEAIAAGFVEPYKISAGDTPFPSGMFKPRGFA